MNNTFPEYYDCTIFGTGIKESVLAGLLSARGYKILQVDSEKSYGSSSKTLGYAEFLSEIQKMEKKYISEKLETFPELLFYVDLTPKIFLADEGLIQVIAKHNLAYSIEFSIIEEQYLIKNDSSLLIPTTKTAALKSRICGPLQLIKLHRFIALIKTFYNANEEERRSMCVNWGNAQDLYSHFGISPYIQEVLGHGIALYTTDKYLQDPPYEFIMRLTTYFRSVARANAQGSSKGNSPFLYPRYGISEVSQGFARLCAVKGGTTRMNTSITSTEADVNNNGYFICLISEESQEERISTGHVIASGKECTFFGYTPVDEKSTLRAVFVLNTSNNPKTSPTRQALISSPPSDLFLLIVGPDEAVCPAGYAIAYLTAEVRETEQLNAEALVLATQQLQKWGYRIIQSVSWIDTSPVYLSGDNPLFTSLLPMDNTVDFRTVLAEVNSVLARFPPSADRRPAPSATLD